MKELGAALSEVWAMLQRVASQIPHDNELQDVLADAVKILEQEGGPVWLSADGSDPLKLDWSELPSLGVNIRDFHIPGMFFRTPIHFLFALGVNRIEFLVQEQWTTILPAAAWQNGETGVAFWPDWREGISQETSLPYGKFGTLWKVE